MSALENLVAAHPFLFRGASPSIPSHLPGGWYELAHELCLGIEGVLGAERCRMLRVDQVKEKFGALRFYYSLAGAANVQPTTTALRALVVRAEEASKATCERCGAAGTLLNHGGWMVTLCTEHAAARASGASGATENES